MRPEKLTVKAQEALAAGQGEARRRDHQAIDVEHLVLALLGQQEGIARPILDKIGAEPSRVVSRLEDELRSVPKVAGAEPYLANRLAKLFDRAEDEAKKLKDEYVSTEHLLLAAAAEKTGAGEALRAAGRHARPHPRGAEGRPRRRARHLARGGEPVPRAREVREGPHRARPAGEARPGDRPRRRDPPRRPDPLPPHEEQPGAGRRPGRRARPPSSRGSRAASWTATCPRG